MIKKSFSLILCGLMLFCLTACRGNTAKEYDTLFDTYPSVFVTENVTQITFYAYYGQGKGIKVPHENMTEIINWLDSFTIESTATDEDITEGINTYYVKIKYSDGTCIKEGLDIVTIDGTRYLLKKDTYPDCFMKIISKATM